MTTRMPARLTAMMVSLIAFAPTVAPAASFLVKDLSDGVDTAPGNGICATSRRTCTLRAAIQETNALVGADQVTLGAGVHELNILGTNENKAAKGNLDVTDELIAAWT